MFLRGDAVNDRLVKFVQQINQKFYYRENIFVIFLHLVMTD